MRWSDALAVVTALTVGCVAREDSAPEGAPAAQVVRIATFNVQELSAAKVDSVDREGRGLHPQVRAAAAVIQAVHPDILLLNEIDVVMARDGTPSGEDPGAVARRFVDAYLARGPHAVSYSYLFAAPVNTGVPSGMDLDGDGSVATSASVGTPEYAEDSYGFGLYPGQYGMAVLSRYPFDRERVRTFQDFRWADLPGNHMPAAFYGPAAPRVRLSSKSHWDVPVRVGSGYLHLLVSHPTPPVFDGPEDRNGRRNFDEIGFWARYLDGSQALVDDRGRRGGYTPGEPFVVLGDLNADPGGGDARMGDTTAISQLLDHPLIRDPAPLQGLPTAEFLGGVRVDWILPSQGIEVMDGGVYQPSQDADPEGARAAAAASDHRLVWLDVRLGGGAP